MTALNLKTNLHKAIDEINDISILEDLNILVNKYIKKEDKDFWMELTAEEKKEIDEALNDIKDEKNLITHEKVMTNMKKWSIK